MAFNGETSRAHELLELDIRMGKKTESQGDRCFEKTAITRAGQKKRGDPINNGLYARN